VTKKERIGMTKKERLGATSPHHPVFSSVSEKSPCGRERVKGETPRLKPRGDIKRLGVTKKVGSGWQNKTKKDRGFRSLKGNPWGKAQGRMVLSLA